jgi:hypothetical protein
MINSNLDTFRGKTVIDIVFEDGIKDLDKNVYRLRLDYDALDSGEKMDEFIQNFSEAPHAAEVEELIIGQWDYDSSNDSSIVVNKLVELKDKFKNLKALFIGDITYEEQEISWIQQSDVSPILTAYPNLEFLQIRGGDNLSLSKLNHPNLKTLIIQTGGLPPNVVKDISNAELPNLETLEVWLGSDAYGFESKIEDLETIINGGKFPKLISLGLKNSIIQDEIAIKVAQSPILDQLHTLDLSMGILTDTGAQALLDSPKIKQLTHLNLNHHFMSDSMMEKLTGLGISISMDDQEDADDEDYRYVEVSE